MANANLEAARAAALIVRQDKALDKQYRFSDGTTGSTRARIEAGAYAYRRVRTYTDGTIQRGLIGHAEAAQGIERSPEGGREGYPNQSHPSQGLMFASYWECPKLIFDFVDLPTVTITPDSFEVETR